MGEIVRLALQRFTNEGLLFKGKGSDALFTMHRFYTKYVSEIETDSPGVYTSCKEILENELGTYQELFSFKVAKSSFFLGLENVTDQDCVNVRYVCECVSRRAAHLVSSGIATLLNKMNEPKVTVGIDGSVYRYHPHFHQLMTEKIQQLVNPGIDVSVVCLRI